MDVGKEITQLPLSSKQQPSTSISLHQMLDRLATQSLNSSQEILETDTYQSLTTKLAESQNKTQMISFIEELVSTILEYSSKLKQELSLSINRLDYAVLQEAIQKSESEIRKHIKIEQQLKLYLDSLQEKIQELQCRLELEEEKYAILFDNFKQLDQSHKKLAQQLSESTETKRVGSQYQFKSTQSASNENVISRKAKLGLKNRLIMEKLQQRVRKTQERKRNQMLNISEEEVALQMQPQPIAKRSSNQRYKKEPKGQYSIKELTKSLQMKQDKSLDSYHYKMPSKSKNEKEGRSSSIIN